MCIIAYVPKDKTVSKEIIENMFINNPDGAGLLYVEKGEVKVFKTFHLCELTAMYEHIKTSFDTDIIIHCRIGTHGGKTLDNIHPFMVNKSLGFVHNGIISNVPLDVAKSDTRMFNEVILQKLPEGFLNYEAVKELIGGYIGSSKLVFMDNKQNVTLINDDKGTWDGGVWFSNGTYHSYSDYYYPEDNWNKYEGAHNASHLRNKRKNKYGGTTTVYNNDYYSSDFYDDDGTEFVPCHGCNEIMDIFEANLDLEENYYCVACYDIYACVLEICPNCEGDLIDAYCENCKLSFNNVYETIATSITDGDNLDVEEDMDKYLAAYRSDEKRYEKWLKSTNNKVIICEDCGYDIPLAESYLVDKEYFCKDCYDYLYAVDDLKKNNVVRLGTDKNSSNVIPLNYNKDNWVGSTYGIRGKDTEFSIQLSNGKLATIDTEK